jgi:ribokinase
VSLPQIVAPEIVVVGSYNRDAAFQVRHLPAPGETCLAIGRLESPGGKGSNQAIQAARCGVATALVAAVGKDPAGDEAIGLWAAEGIDAAAVARLDQPTGAAVIFVDGRGENAIVVDPGANAGLGVIHVEAAAAKIAAAHLVLAQLETPQAPTRRAFAVARAAGVRTVLNAAPALEILDEDILALTDVLVVNVGEGLALTGHTEATAIGEALVARVGEAVVITRGVRGALLVEKTREPYARRAHAIEAIDTTGAGDAFIGALCARLAASCDPREALAWGVAAGALACTVRGAAVSFAAAARIAALAKA